MNKNELIQLASNRNLISGIYNYCDRWCERCAFTGRCLAFAAEKADGKFEDAAANDINNAGFWQRLETTFNEVRQMIVEWAEEEGIDLKNPEDEDSTAEREQQRYQAKHHGLSMAAENYALTVQSWFEEEFAVEESVHDDVTGKSKSADDDIDVSDAIEIIRWYQFFMAAKVSRALMGSEPLAAVRAKPDEEDPIEPHEAVDLLAKTKHNDSNGSAKIALIAIDRSLSAWRVLQQCLPEKSDSMVPILMQLDRLRRSLEDDFPAARDFIRPGFDETESELVS